MTTSSTQRATLPAIGRTGRTDETRIDVRDFDGLERWAQQLNVTPGQLRVAVALVGASKDKVVRLLGAVR